MSATANDPNLLGRLFDWIKDRFHTDNELYTLSHGDFAMMASDLGICESDLREVLPKADDNSALMDEMMLQRGLNPDRVRRLAGGLARLGAEGRHPPAGESHAQRTGRHAPP